MRSVTRRMQRVAHAGLAKPSGVLSQEFEDSEGLVVNSGIINALIASFAIPLLVSVGMDVFERGDFWYLLNGSHEFRKFAIEVMDVYDIGTYEHETFNWTVEIEGHQTIDIKKILLESPTQTTSSNNLQNQDDGFRANLNTAFAALAEDFPMWQMHAWQARHRKYLGGGSDATIQFITLSVALLMIGIVGSMFLYVSLTISSARESKHSLAKWNRVGIPMAVVLYVNTVIAIVCFFYGTFNLVFSCAPRLDQGVWALHIGVYALLIPGAIVVFLVSVFAICLAGVNVADSADSADIEKAVGEAVHRSLSPE